MPESNATLGLVRFEGFQLDFRSGELLKDGAETVLLPAQSFQILTMLLNILGPGGKPASIQAAPAARWDDSRV